MRNRVLTGLHANGVEVRMAMDHVWVSESEKAAPDWNHCLQVFERVFDLALEWKFDDFAFAALRGIAIIQDEYLDNPAAAHAAIDQLENRLGRTSYEIADRRASVFYDEGKFAEAEATWREALAEWPPAVISYDNMGSYAARNAGMAAAKQEKWEQAALYLLEIPKRLKAPVNPKYSAAAFGDAAYAYWKAGNSKRAINLLIDAWHEIDSLPAGKADLEIFRVRKSVGHMIGWIYQAASGDTQIGLNEPVAGLCSNPYIHEKLKDLPEGDGGGPWILLIRLERTYEAGNRALQYSGSQLTAGSPPGTRVLGLTEQIGATLDAGDMNDLPLRMIALANAIANVPVPSEIGYTPPARSEAFQPEDSMVGPSIFLAALIAAAARGLSMTELVKGWLSSIEGTSEATTWKVWFDEVSRIMYLPLNEASRLCSKSTNWREGMLATVNVLTSKEQSADELYLAQVRWMSELRTSPWFTRISLPFLQLIEAGWRRAIINRATLRSPSLSVPAIEQACDSSAPGLIKAFAILKAAKMAVSATMPNQMWADIERGVSTSSI